MVLNPFHKRLVLIAFAGLVIYLMGNDATSLWDRDEPRFAEAAREMVASGDYIVPHFHGEVRYDKPPLIYWLMAGSYKLFGVGAFGARFPSAVAGALCLFFSGVIGRRLLGESVGLSAAVVLGLSLQFIVEAKVATTDAVLLATILLGQLSILRSWQGESGWGTLLAGWVAVGLGLLAKGPVAPIVLGATALSLKFVGGQPWPWRPAAVAVGSGIALLLVAPWVVAVQVATDGEFLRVAVGHHVIERAARPFESHRGPFWYYLAALPVSFFPWSFWGFSALYALWHQRKKAPARFLLAWLTVPFVIFSLIATKLPHYVLPVYPSLAIAVSWLMLDPIGPRWWRALATLNGLLATAIGVTLAIGSNRFFPDDAPPALPLLGVCFLLVAASHLGARWRWQIPGVAMTTALTLACLCGVALPALEHFKPSPRMAAALKEAAPRERRYAFGYFEPSLVFYTGDTVSLIKSREDLEVLLASPAPYACVMREEVWQEIAPHLSTTPMVQEIKGVNVAKGKWRRWVVVASE